MSVKNIGEQPRRTAEFLRFDEGEEKELTVNEWTFGRGPGGYLFKAYVEGENGEDVDKIWTVWDYDSTQLLKKKLKGNGPKTVKVKMVMNEEDEQSFELVK